MNCKLSTVAVIKKFSFYSADVSVTPNLVMRLDIHNFQIYIFERPSFRNIIKYKALDKHPNLEWNRKQNNFLLQSQGVKAVVLAFHKKTAI